MTAPGTPDLTPARHTARSGRRGAASRAGDVERGSVSPGSVFFVVGTCCVVLGGLVAAVTEPLQLDKGSWLAAYLVLVCGVAQCAIGTAQPRLAGRPIPPVRSWTQLASWNLGNTGVVAGTLTGAVVLVDLGGALLVITLGIALHAARRPAAGLLGWVYRCLLVVLLLSVPIGLVLAHLRA